MEPAFVFYGSIKTHRTFKSKGGGLIVQLEVANKDHGSWLGNNEDVDFRFELTQGKDPSTIIPKENDPNQLNLDDLEEDN